MGLGARLFSTGRPSVGKLPGMTLAQMLAEALTLPLEERAELADELLASFLPPTADESDMNWQAALERRTERVAPR